MRRQSSSPHLTWLILISVASRPCIGSGAARRVTLISGTLMTTLGYTIEFGGWVSLTTRVRARGVLTAGMFITVLVRADRFSCDTSC